MFSNRHIFRSPGLAIGETRDDGIQVLITARESVQQIEGQASRLLKYCLTHPESTIWQYYFLRKSLMFGSHISRRTVKSVNFLTRKQYFSSLLKLYRYSEKRWLDRSLKLGEFRLRPASEYLAMEAAAARQDDERNIVTILKKGTFVIRHADSGEVIDTIGDVTHTSSIERDYFILCFSKNWGVNHFKHFEGSDSCLIIHDPVQFLERIHALIEKQHPSWISVDASVTYGGLNQLGVPFTKPEEYTFQSEHRLVVIPDDSIDLSPQIITIGSIEDVAEIVDASYSIAAT